MLKIIIFNLPTHPQYCRYNRFKIQYTKSGAAGEVEEGVEEGGRKEEGGRRKEEEGRRKEGGRAEGL